MNLKKLMKIRRMERYDKRRMSEMYFSFMNDNDMGESCYLLEDFGKNVFLTKAEAEQKLKEMESD